MSIETWDLEIRDKCVSHIDTRFMQSHQDEKSHATDNHTKQVYIIQIYTQANQEEYLTNDSMLYDKQDNI